MTYFLDIEETELMSLMQVFFRFLKFLKQNFRIELVWVYKLKTGAVS